MKLMNCPLNGLRNISEFVCGGEVSHMPDPKNGSDKEWADFIFMENNTKGVIKEWWLHAATSYWFIAERNTETDEIINTYPANKIFNKKIEFKD